MMSNDEANQRMVKDSIGFHKIQKDSIGFQRNPTAWVLGQQRLPKESNYSNNTPPKDFKGYQTIQKDLIEFKRTRKDSKEFQIILVAIKKSYSQAGNAQKANVWKARRIKDLEVPALLGILKIDLDCYQPD